MKDLKALGTFKNEIKKWIPKNCTYRLCKVYVAQVGFLWPFINLGIGIGIRTGIGIGINTTLLRHNNTPFFPVPLGLWTPNLAGW